MSFPQVTNHASSPAAESDFLNQLTTASAAAPTALSLPELVYGALANLIAGFRYYTTGSISPTIVNANTTSEQTFTVTGLKTGDVVVVNKPTHQTGLSVVGCRVSAANTLAIQFCNNTAGNITPTASETYKVLAFGIV